MRHPSTLAYYGNIMCLLIDVNYELHMKCPLHGEKMARELLEVDDQLVVFLV